MKLQKFVGFALFVSTVLIGFSSALAQPAVDPLPLRTHTRIDADWLFHRNDLPESDQAAVTNADFDEKGWEHVKVPHDYILDGAYDKTNERNHGYLPYMPAWYRKHLTVPAADQGKILQLDFDGVYRDSKVWFNGTFLGEHKSGYTGFAYDISKLVHFGADNIITVRVDPTQDEGWWYEGGGIYRHVYYNAINPLHVIPFGTYVVSTVPKGNEGASATANIMIQTTIKNDTTETAHVQLVSEVTGPDGSAVFSLTNEQTLPGDGQNTFVQNTTISKPQLWSPAAPNLYHLHTLIVRDGTATDSADMTFGIRTIHYDANRGFFLNGKHVEIQGVALHQDFPAVGIAVPDSLQEYRVKQLKKGGVNGWRTAHNPPTEQVLDDCDRLGMLVMEENRHLGDTYHHHSPEGTQPGNLADLAWMIQRDRNHPSVIMWSMCNEEGLQGKPEGAAIFTAMMKMVHRYDQTRPITCAMNAGLFGQGFATVEDIIGVNYNTKIYGKIHAAYPLKPMYGSESANLKTARGNYVEDKTTGMSSAYNLTDSEGGAVATNHYMSGMYTWTGFDYKGEPNPYGWPDVANNTGLLDSCGFPKDKFYYFESWWSDKPMVHLLPIRWNWENGQPIRVIAYSNAREVELLLNGKSLGKKRVPEANHAEWKVPFEPGELVARAYAHGKVIATDEVDTVGAPATIALTPERTDLQSGADDTVVLPVSILDSKGRLVPMADNRVTFSLTGDGKILGVGNGNPADHDPDRAVERNAFNGRCIAVVQAGATAGQLVLTATSHGLAPATVTLQVK